MWTEKNALGWMENAHEAERTERGILGVKRALELLGRAHVDLRRAYRDIEKDTLVVWEGTWTENDTLGKSTWGQDGESGTDKGILRVRGHSNCWKGRMWSLEGHISVLRMAL